MASNPFQGQEKQEPRAALREVAARISDLSFRDMLTLANALRENMGSQTVLASTPATAEAILNAAETLRAA